MSNPALNVETVVVSFDKRAMPIGFDAAYVEARGACSIGEGWRTFLMEHWAMSTDWTLAAGSDAQAELQRQYCRLQLLLNLTSHMTDMPPAASSLPARSN